MTIVSKRLLRRIDRDFPEPGSAAAVIDMVTAVAGETERVQAAVVMLAEGDLALLRDACDLATLDWRDVLVNAGLAATDWPSRLEDELGPPD